MGLVVTATAAFALWIVIWALTAKGFDAFLITATVIVLGAAARLLVPYLPGGKRD